MSCVNRPNGSMQISDVLLVVGSMGLAYLGSIPFSVWLWLRLTLALPGGCLIAWAIRCWRRKRQQVFILEQFKWLLEHLLTRLTAGATLESAFVDATASLSRILGRNSLLLLGLAAIGRQLAAHQPLNLILPPFARFLPCPEARRFFEVLVELRDSGGQVGPFVRQQLHRCSDQLALYQDLQAETTQRQTEALLLTAMPFILAHLLSDAGNMLAGDVAPTVVSRGGMLLAYALGILAAGFVFSTLGYRLSNSGKTAILKTGNIRPIKWLCSPGAFLKKIYQDLLPESFGGRLLQILQMEKGPVNHAEQNLVQSYFQVKAACMLVSLLPGVMLILAEPHWWFSLPLLPVLTGLLHDQNILHQVRQRQIQYQLEYPVYLNFIAALLQAGLSVRIALDISLQTFGIHQAKNRQARHDTILSRDLAEISKLLQIGMPADQVIDRVAADCLIPDAQAALFLIARYDRDGGQEILQMLHMQAVTCWSLYRNTVRRQLERQALLLLLPMTMDLVSVILIAVMPAIQSLSAI
jgi:Flp pilus assembly protein TadB